MRVTGRQNIYSKTASHCHLTFRWKNCTKEFYVRFFEKAMRNTLIPKGFVILLFLPERGTDLELMSHAQTYKNTH